MKTWTTKLNAIAAAFFMLGAAGIGYASAAPAITANGIAVSVPTASLPVSRVAYRGHGGYGHGYGHRGYGYGYGHRGYGYGNYYRPYYRRYGYRYYNRPYYYGAYYNSYYPRYGYGYNGGDCYNGW